LVSRNAFAAVNASVVGYDYQGEVRSTRTQYWVTYSVTVLNSGASLPGLTAKVHSTAPNVQTMPGKDVLHFGPLASGAQGKSVELLTILVDRSVPFSFSSLVWTFDNPVANAGPNQTAGIGATVNLNGTGSSNPSGVGTLTFLWSFASVPAGSHAALTG